MTTSAQRATMVELLDDLVSHAAQVHYLQRRPMQTVIEFRSAAALRDALHEGRELSMDCSEFVTLVCKLAGLTSPSGPHFPYSSGWGNTDTMAGFLPHYRDPRSAYPGAIVGWYGGDFSRHHVAMVFERSGSNPWLASHGSEIGPLRVRLDAESAAHAGQPRTFLSVAGL